MVLASYTHSDCLVNSFDGLNYFYSLEYLRDTSSTLIPTKIAREITL